jgi:hypothetical protein
MHETAERDDLPARAPWVVALVALGLYAAWRVRWVGGCDATSYLLESYRLRGVEAGLAFDPSVPFPGALAPLCMVEHQGEALTFFPPGYPLLLAAAGLVGLEFHVNPVLAVGSALALFALMRDRAGGWAALALMVAFLASPLVLWGGTMMMSDLPSMALLVFSLLAVRRGWPVVAGVLFGVSLGVRPTDALALPALILLAPTRRDVHRAGAGAAAAMVGWALVLRVLLGRFGLPYADNLSNLTGAHFVDQLVFLVQVTAQVHGPVVALAAVGLWRRPKAVAPLAAWYAAFALAYALWQVPFDAWWRARYVLPGLPAMYLAAAEGAAVLLERRAPRRLAVALGVVVTVGYAGWSVRASPVVPHLNSTFDRGYALDALRTARRVPDDALVGAVAESGTLRLYGALQSFFWCHPQAPALVTWAMERGRPLFAVLDDYEAKCFGQGAPPLELVLVERLSTGRSLLKVECQRDVEVVDLGEPSARARLLEGWAGDERDGTLTFVGATARSATLQMPAPASPGDVLAKVTLQPFEGAGVPQTVEALVDGESLARATLTSGMQSFDVLVPARLAGKVLELRFGFAVSPKSLGVSGDERPLAAAVDRVIFSAAR